MPGLLAGWNINNDNNLNILKLQPEANKSSKMKKTPLSLSLWLTGGHIVGRPWFIFPDEGCDDTEGGGEMISR